MKWREMRRSGNVQDVRGRGRGIGRPVAAAGGLGIGGVLIVLLLSALTGANPGDIIGGAPQQAPGNSLPPSASGGVADRDSEFVRAVLGDTEDTWAAIFQSQLGQRYTATRLVLFSDAAESACGFAEAASGPFYCPPDQSIYLDMSFFGQIRATAGNNADFARAYAIAHEVGHHVQNQMGLLSQVRNLQRQASQTEANDLQVRLELQADCYAGVWGNHTGQRGLIDNQDIEGAFNTAAQIGDDYLQKASRGYVVPESFTHGTSAQRVEWFRRGLQTGDVRQCDTFQ